MENIRHLHYGGKHRSQESRVSKVDYKSTSAAIIRRNKSDCLYFRIPFRRLDTDLKLQQAAGLKYGSGGAGAHARVGCSSAAGWHQRRPHSCRELPLAALFSRLTSGLFGFRIPKNLPALRVSGCSSLRVLTARATRSRRIVDCPLH